LVEVRGIEPRPFACKAIGDTHIPPPKFCAPLPVGGGFHTLVARPNLIWYPVYESNAAG